MIRLSRAADLTKVERRNQFGGYDGWLIFSVACLMLFGLMSLYSVSQAQPANAAVFKNQLIRIAIGIVPFALFLWVPLQTWRKLIVPLYLLNFLLLLLVQGIGQTRGGAQRWLQIGPLEFQPSEMAKLVVVLTVAVYLASLKDEVRSLTSFLTSLALVLPPTLLVFIQPHLGATLVIFVSWLAVCVISGVRWRWIIGFILVGVLIIPGVMLGYQSERIQGLLSGDKKTNAYQQYRASIAFAEGGVGGTGYLQGEQKKRGYIPAQRTDFILTTVGEEGGLIGMTLLLSSFGLFFGRVWWIIVRAQDPLKRAIAAGIFATLGFHAVVNIGMNLAIFPVVGLWLPFMSYGGTAIWLSMGCVGLLLQIGRSGADEGMF